MQATDGFMTVSMPILTLLIFLPILGAILTAFLPREESGLHRGVALTFGLVTFALSLVLLKYDPDFSSTTATVVSSRFPTMQFVESYGWIDGLGARYTVGIDGISLWLVLLTTFLQPIMILSTFSAVTERVKEFMIALLVLQAGMIGALVALDGLLFYIFWELMLIPMYFMIGIWGGAQRHYATLKFFLYTMVGSLLMLIALLYVYFGTDAVTAGGGYSFSLAELMAVPLSEGEQYWLFGAFALAFAIKVPLFPFHTWLPDAHVQAPTAGSVILAGVLLKMGTYGLMRYAMPMFPEAMVTFAPWIAVLSVIGIVYGAVVAMVQEDVKKLVAYSSVSHLGFCMLGLAALTPQSVEGAMYVMLAHGVATGGLFLAVGVIYERRHTRLIADFGGLAKVTPVFATFFMIIVFTSAGVPGLAGFVGEFLVLMGASQSQVLHFGEATYWFESVSGAMGPEANALVFAGIAASGVIFGAVYLLWMFQRVMFGPIKNPKNAKMQDLGVREVLYMTPLLVMCFVMGLFPEVFMSRMHSSVDAFMEQMRPGIQAKLTAEQRQVMQLSAQVNLGAPASPAPAASAPSMEAAKPRPSAGDEARVREMIRSRGFKLNDEGKKRIQRLHRGAAAPQGGAQPSEQ